MNGKKLKENSENVSKHVDETLFPLSLPLLHSD